MRARHVEEFERRRDSSSTFERSGRLVVPSEPVAPYVFPSIARLGKPSAQVADVLLREAGVASLSGTAFGAFGEGYLRFSYANSQPNIRKALERIGAVAAGAR